MAIDYGETPPGLPLREDNVDPDPIVQFQRWYRAAASAGQLLPDAMTLATATPDGGPSARMVLLRGCDERGFVFYTNYDSRKGHELSANPRAALVFFWAPLERQVRVEGRVEPVTAEESDAYFRTRPRASQLGAWASPQSQVLAGRETLDRRLEDVLGRFAGADVPRPPHWGGYRVVPDEIEFWQAREGRLHDRLCYRRRQAGGWSLQRLAP